MNKKIKVFLISILLLVLSTGTVKAVDATADLSTDNTTIKAGETFVVKFTAKCDDGINGVETTIDYDESKLELVKIEVSDTNKWSNIGSNTQVQIFNSGSGTEKEGTIFNITFKAKDNVESGSTEIATKNIVIDSDASTNSKKEIGTKNITVSLTKEEGSAQKDEPKNDNQDKITDNSTNTSADDKLTNDTTVADEDIPQTGLTTVILPIIVSIAIVVACISYAKYKKYKAI